METKVEVKTPLRLADELTYGKEEILNKPVIGGNGGSVTLLAFDKGTMIARHQADADVMVYVLEGAIEFEVEDQRQHLTAGNALVMPPNTPHTVLALEKSKVLLTKIKA